MVERSPLRAAPPPAVHPCPRRPALPRPVLHPCFPPAPSFFFPVLQHPHLFLLPGHHGPCRPGLPERRLVLGGQWPVCMLPGQACRRVAREPLPPAAGARPACRCQQNTLQASSALGAGHDRVCAALSFFLSVLSPPDPAVRLVGVAGHPAVHAGLPLPGVRRGAAGAQGEGGAFRKGLQVCLQLYGCKASTCPSGESSRRRCAALRVPPGAGQQGTRRELARHRVPPVARDQLADHQRTCGCCLAVWTELWWGSRAADTVPVLAPRAGTCAPAACPAVRRAESRTVAARIVVGFYFFLFIFCVSGLLFRLVRCLFTAVTASSAPPAPTAGTACRRRGQPSLATACPHRATACNPALRQTEAYAANLGAFLTVIQLESSVTTLADLRGRAVGSSPIYAARLARHGIAATAYPPNLVQARWAAAPAACCWVRRPASAGAAALGGPARTRRALTTACCLLPPRDHLPVCS